MKLCIKIITALFTLSLGILTYAANQGAEIVIRDHLFFPSTLELPAGQKIRLVIINEDSTAEEFESYELNREKVIPGNSRTVVFIGPLTPGEYPFFGEFYPRTAQGMIIIK
jgi:hypothetical protein